MRSMPSTYSVTWSRRTSATAWCTLRGRFWSQKRATSNAEGASMSGEKARVRLGVSLALVACALAAAGLVPLASSRVTAEPAQDSLAVAYTKQVRPLFQRHCWRCHSGKRQEADVDLGSFTTFADVRKAPRTWQKVLEMLDSGQMPPKEARQPSDADRSRLRTWVRAYLKTEARTLAGDPGP